MSDVTTIGIDIAKHVFQVYGVDAQGEKVLSRRLRRGELLAYMSKQPKCLVGMEACGSAHYWGRALNRLGHRVRLMAPQFVKPYVKGNKTDSKDAIAICEAVSRPSMHFVPVKNCEQQAMNCRHRLRSRLVAARTALTNQLRGFLYEFGIVIRKGHATVHNELPGILEDAANELPADTRELLAQMYEQLCRLDKAIDCQNTAIEQQAERIPSCRYLQTIPGIGKLTSTALHAAIGTGAEFTKGRQVSALMGLTPRVTASGDRVHLGGITKRGDRYLRTLLIHGARAVLQAASRKQDAYHQWALALSKRVGRHKAVVAIASKNARIAWAVMSHQQPFQVDKASGYSMGNESVAGG